MSYTIIRSSTTLRAHPETGEPIPFKESAHLRIKMISDLHRAIRNENQLATDLAKHGYHAEAARIDANVSMARGLFQRTMRREWLSLMEWAAIDKTKPLADLSGGASQATAGFEEGNPAGLSYPRTSEEVIT